METEFLKIALVCLTFFNTLSALDTSSKQEQKTPGWHTQASSTRTVNNLTNLVYQYYLVCGSEYICEKQNYGFIRNHQPIGDLELCPRCSCNKHCVQKGDCCPDIMFSFPDPVCQNTSIIDNLLNPNNQSNIIVACHDESSNEMKEKCNMNFTNAQLIQNPPVTSANYAFTFRNKYCAECNGVFNYFSWGINILCEKFADFNFLSTYGEIMDYATAEACKVEYEEDQESSKHKCKPTKFQQPFPIDQCNVTGTWLTYDRDIANACLSDYHLNYKTYKNVFCLLCNPPVLSTEPVTSCNVSGSWSLYEASLMNECVKLNATQSTMPYKNVFCFLCNRNNTSRFRYDDADAIIELTDFRPFIYRIRILEYALDYYNDILGSTGITDNDLVATHLNSSTSLNHTRLILLHYAMFGTNSYCSAEFPGGFFVDSPCSCDESCLFSSSAPFCCHDFLLNSTTSCLDSDVSGSDHFAPLIGAISGCNDIPGQNSIRSRCSSRNAKDIFGMLPVTAGDTIFKNFDCFRCNKPAQNLTSHWNFQIECDSYQHFNYFIKVMDIIEHAQRSNCVIRMIPENPNNFAFQMSSIYCSNHYNTSRCNVTGLWSAYDKDIALACESLDLFLPKYRDFKNVYCFMCNRPSTSSITGTTVDTCMVSAENQWYGENITTACTTLPEVHGFKPFRNIFCATCSVANATIIPDIWFPSITMGGRHTVHVDDDHVIVQTSYQDLFSFTSPSVSVELEVLEVGNDDNVIYDRLNNRKHNLTCFPGKTLVEKKCRPLLKNTKNLRYVLAFSLEGNSSTTSPDLLLITVRTEIKSKIHSMDGYITFDYFHIALNISCDANYNGSIGIRILVHASLLIVTKVNRLMAEEKLINMTRMKYNIDNSTYLTADHSVDAFILPAVLGTLSFTRQCYKTETKPRDFTFQQTFRPAVVSDLLLCTHVVLQSQDYAINRIEMSLTLDKSRRSFNSLEYLLVGNEARICLDDFRETYENYLNTDETKPEINIALGIVTLICTIVSLACLFLTFMTYCLFPVMRSLPGINNMNLVVMMFFAQLLFQVGFNQTSITELCRTIGIFIHFFWLSTFTCMSVCSFHMYSVFAGELMSGRQTGSWKKRIMTYMLYSHGLPALVIVINIIILSSTSEEGGIGYGNTRCFISNKVSFYTTFLVPVLLICISNIYFFTRTALKIKGTPKVESTQEKRNDFVIYVKLFSLTGITWILLVIDTLFSVSAFSFLVVFFTVCQGLFVFVSFVLNKRVLKRYFTLCCSKNMSRDNTTSQTTKSTMANSSTV
ncbi:uncharacterized protein LOC110464408 [Mizuhopecten yessoensis]|uniref:Latrophilin-3 n=1 Tax=Mizuhopecten yessoensis TaxID=6573 RepID=A0A210PTV3_MIZYE|nr:uncharacterized protein LOC110464408 [Mizuhopecten yessoensis]OWF39937.1 Latrophilin-3 [Mizuhopecten yessoensis]